MYWMFSGVTLSTQYYDTMLINWSQLSLENDVLFDGGESKYCSEVADARAKITSDFNCSIWDYGLSEE